MRGWLYFWADTPSKIESKQAHSVKRRSSVLSATPFTLFGWICSLGGYWIAHVSHDVVMLSFHIAFLVCFILSHVIFLNTRRLLPLFYGKGSHPHLLIFCRLLKMTWQGNTNLFLLFWLSSRVFLDFWSRRYELWHRGYHDSASMPSVASTIGGIK